MLAEHTNEHGADARRNAPRAWMTSRRAFLTYGTGAAVVALGATGVGRALRSNRSVSGARELIAARGVDVVGSPADAAGY